MGRLESRTLKSTNKIQYGLSWLIMLLGGCYAIYIRFSNPDLTETRLLIDKWEQWLIVLIILIGGYLIGIQKKKG